MFLKKLLLTTSVATAALILNACSNSVNANQGRKNSTLHLMETSDLLSLDNSNEADVTQWDVLTNSMEGLYRASAKGKLMPAVATKVVKPTNHGKTYTFKLRNDAKWANGEPVTAQDFVFAWRRSASNQSQSGYNYIFKGIKNATAISEGKKPESSLGVKALNKHTLQVELEYPMPYFGKKMVMPAFFPQYPGVVKKYGKAYGTSSQKMVYDGPFEVKGWNGNNESWSLVKNKDYWDRKDIKLNRINMQVVKDANTAHQLFETNKLDDATITGTTAQGLQYDRNLLHQKDGGNYFLRVNMAKGHVLANAKMREALSLVLNRDELTKKVLADGSEPDTTYTAPRTATDPTTGKDFAQEMSPGKKYNVAKARKLWNEGLKEEGRKSATLQLVGDDQTISKNVCQFVQSQVESKLSNAKVEVRNIPSKSATDRAEKGNFDLHYTLWLNDFADPISTLETMEVGNSHNMGKYADTYYNAQLNQARSQNADDQANYWQNLRNAEKRLDNDNAALPLYTMVQSHLVRSNLKGVLRHPVGMTDYTRAYFK